MKVLFLLTIVCAKGICSDFFVESGLYDGRLRSHSGPFLSSQSLFPEQPVACIDPKEEAHASNNSPQKTKRIKKSPKGSLVSIQLEEESIENKRPSNRKVPKEIKNLKDFITIKENFRKIKDIFKSSNQERREKITNYLEEDRKGEALVEFSEKNTTALIFINETFDYINNLENFIEGCLENNKKPPRTKGNNKKRPLRKK